MQNCEWLVVILCYFNVIKSSSCSHYMFKDLRYVVAYCVHVYDCNVIIKGSMMIFYCLLLSWLLLRVSAKFIAIITVIVSVLYKCYHTISYRV